MPWTAGNWYIYYPENAAGFGGSSAGPVNGATGVAVNTALSLAVRPDTFEQIDLDSDLRIEINGVQVWSHAGGWETGYSGGVTYTRLDANPTPPNPPAFLGWSFGPHPDFPASTLMTVEVLGNSLGVPVSNSFSFTTGTAIPVYTVTDSDPADSTTDVPTNATVSFSIESDQPIDTGLTEIWVGGVLAFTDAGGWETGFDGTVTYPTGDTAEVTITTHPGWSPGDTVEIEFVGGPSSASFSFAVLETYVEEDVAGLTAFNRLLGETQGRIEPVNANPPNGSFTFALGSDEQAVKYPINLGDSVRVEQTADVTGIKLIRFQAILRPPASSPAGTRWLAEWGVGNVVHGRRTLPTSEPVHLRDGAVNVSSMSGNKVIFFRLRFVGTGPIVDLESITPAGGTPLGGTTVTLKGAGFTGATDVDFNGVSLSSVSVVDDNTITAVTPAHDLGQVNVRVSHPNGDAWILNGYRYKLLIPEDRYMELMFVSSPESTALTAPGEVIGSRNIDVSILPVETKHWFFVATLLSEDVGNHSYVELWDVTHNVMVASAVLNNSAAPDVTQAYTVVSAELTAGTSSGDIRTDVACEYEVRLRRVNGSAGQYVTCTNAHVRIVFDG